MKNKRGQIQQTAQQPVMVEKKKSTWWIWILVFLLVIGIGIFIYVGVSVDWWRTYNANEIKSLCSDTCDEKDFETFCQKKIYYKRDSGATRASCYDHSINSVVDYCPDANSCRSYK